MSETFLHLRKIGEKIVQTGNQSYLSGNRRDNFVEWSCDGDVLVVKNDRLGFRPLFYHQCEGEISVSPQIVKLIERGASVEIDDGAMSVFLRLGYFIGDDTPFKAIRALPPNSILTWRDGCFDLQNHGLPKHQKLEISFDKAVDYFAEIFGNAIKKMLPRSENFVVPISGGRDSRHIFLELLRQGAKPLECVTLKHFPPRSDEDAKVAAELCKIADVPHVLLEQPQKRLPNEFRKNLLTNFCADEHGWYLPMADYVEKFDCLYDGIAGDIFLEGLSGRIWTENTVSLYQNHRFTELAENLLGAEAYLPQFLRTPQYERFNRRLAIERLTVELEKHVDEPNPISAFHFWNRTRREIALAPFSMLSASTKVFAPYLEPETIDFLMSLPLDLVKNRKLRETAIKKAYPKFASVEYENKNAAQKLDYKNLRHFGQEVLSFITAQKSDFVKSSFITKHILRGFLQPNHREAVTWFAPQILHLVQLERFIQTNGL
ncbi:MAG: hypothetical protein H7Z37_08730 [Pyrinomonadaceae bacterium]|nr:hypothetical protein [Pyrinomonadaceae bacterium]